MAYAFRCKNCGRLVPSADAGECDFPAACPSCGHGVTFDPITGVKNFEDGGNWDTLVDLDADERKTLADDHGLAQKDLIEKHEPAAVDPNPDHEPTSISAEAGETVGQEDEA